MNEIPGQAFAFERHLDDLDLDVGEDGESVEAIDRGAIDVERRFVLRGTKAFAHLIIVTRAQIESRGRDPMAGRGEALGVAAHFVGDVDAGVEPSLVVLRAFACERPSDLVQLADVGAAVARAAEHVDEGRRPPVVAGKVHEIFRRLRHRSLPLAQSQAGARPAGLAILRSSIRPGSRERRKTRMNWAQLRCLRVRSRAIRLSRLSYDFARFRAVSDLVRCAVTTTTLQPWRFRSRCSRSNFASR